MDTTHSAPVRIGIRGAAGLLGSRLLVAMGRTKDLRATVGICRKDPTLERMVSRMEFGGLLARQALPEKIYIEAGEEDIAALNAKIGEPRFFPIREIDLADACDVVIDAATSATGKERTAVFQGFTGPIILQDGAYPHGRLIAPPLIAASQGGNRFRQGGCFISGVMPVLAAFQEGLKRARMYLIMQYDGREADFLITERVITFRVADQYRPRMREELAALLPDARCEVMSVIQIPGMLHYAVTLELECHGSLTAEDVREILRTIPRVRYLPPEVNGTYELNLARVLDDRIPPITPLGSTLEVQSSGGTTNVRLVLALYYRTLAVLPNLDAIRMLIQGMNPIDAMRQTDRDMGFCE